MTVPSAGSGKFWRSPLSSRRTLATRSALIAISSPAPKDADIFYAGVFDRDTVAVTLSGASRIHSETSEGKRAQPGMTLPGQLITRPSGLDVKTHSVSEHLSVINLAVDVDALSEDFDYDFRAPPFRPSSERVGSPRLLRCGQRLAAAVAREPSGSKLAIEGLALELLSLVVGPAHVEASRAPRWAGRSKPQLTRVCDLLQNDLAAEPSLAQLSASVGLSTGHFWRAFAASNGLPPHRWLMEQRILRARELLVQISRPIADVAAAAGFADPSYFSRLFKRHTGTTPIVYRRGAT